MLRKTQQSLARSREQEVLLKALLQCSLYLGARSWLGVVGVYIWVSRGAYTLKDMVPHVTLIQTEVLFLEKSVLGIVRGEQRPLGGSRLE